MERNYLREAEEIVSAVATEIPDGMSPQKWENFKMDLAIAIAVWKAEGVKSAQIHGVNCLSEHMIRLYVKDRITQEERDEIVRHLAHCPHCSVEAMEARKAWKAVLKAEEASKTA